jgi:hypothetical protein
LGDGIIQFRQAEVKRLGILVALVLILAGLLLSGIFDTSASVADYSIPDNEAISSVSEASN